MRIALMAAGRFVVFSLLPVVTVAFFLGAGAPAASKISGSLGAFVEPSNCGDCAGCIGGHMAPPSESGTIGGLHSWCMQIVDCTHPGCGVARTSPATPGMPMLEDLVQLALAGSRAAVRNIVLLYPEKAHYNATRHALQVEGCNRETIVAHVPLDAATLADVQQYFPNEGLYASR